MSVAIDFYSEPSYRAQQPEHAGRRLALVGAGAGPAEADAQAFVLQLNPGAGAGAQWSPVAPAKKSEAAPLPTGRLPTRSLPLRITTRGRVAIAACVLFLGAALLGVSHFSQPAPTVARLARSEVVVVQSGDTLWSIAQRLAPASDPRRTVARLVAINDLASVDVVVGQTLAWH